MIKELAAKSHGAQIKIMSEKQNEHQIKDCVIRINGSLQNKQEACKLILEKIESINQNPHSTNQRYQKRDHYDQIAKREDRRDYHWYENREDFRNKRDYNRNNDYRYSRRDDNRMNYNRRDDYRNNGYWKDSYWKDSYRRDGERNRYE